MLHNATDLIWTTTLIHELVAQGVTYFCLSPGSRSTPLTLAVSTHPHAETLVHFDERAMAFHALGYAKASRKPVAIIVTSGTAAGNLLPALMEAHESAIPLIVLTADRPDELQECGANQTTMQSHMFQNYVRWQCTLPTPTSSIATEYLKTTVAHAIAKATKAYPGPVHLNCPFREPFSFSHSLSIPHTALPKTQLLNTTSVLEESSLDLLSNLINQSRKGMILLGYEALEERDLVSFYELAELLKWPIFADVLSQGRNHPLSISYYECAWSILKSHPEHEESFYPDCVLHFGGAFVSKHLIVFLKQAAPLTYIHVLPYEKRQDPAHLITHRVTSSAGMLCKQLASSMTPSSSDYLLQWQQVNHSIKTTLEEVFKTPQPLNEPQLAYTLSHYDLSHYALFLANGMPIRDCTQFFHPAANPQHIYGNRGLSGIDGNIATSIGIAKALAIPTISILGDQTFLHDVTSLNQLKCLLHPMIFLIINNDGGTIFSFLPVYEKKEFCQHYLINPHHLSFASIASFFQLHYHHCSSLEALNSSLSHALSSSRHHLIEIKTELEINLNVHQTIKQTLLEHAAHPLFRQ